MRNKILILGAIAFVAYVVGSRSVTVKKSESVPHQLVRMRDERRTKKDREKKAKKIAADVKGIAKDVRKRFS
ncbi:hypothetical protein [Microbacterium oleivorans]|uniref:Uncharacterized protein n=1 Tax=Microbacterium oleivorans TaxID=273677 RepID=A0A031FSF1_9MICO|nr:hypothetical protein [Microbacterium oleivorans]AZS45251.1 hypothetical protein BWL13_02850 [Microbacterium oleivorans]EZP27764.1 hypothetical protein BW34_01756 [Microbacterium oleivorans]THE07637.1 hypothetical protein E1I21_06595 [Microbacterium oleivorans]